MRFRGASIAVLGLLLTQGASLAQTVGNVGAVNPQVAGTPSGAAAAQALTLGASVVFKERIATSAEGTAQVTFLDKSTLNVGRNSSIVIDKFIYNPEASTGEMAISMTKGVMRFVGGQISHTSGVKVTTPIITAGIRGGTATIIFLPGGHVMVINHFGRIDVANDVSSQAILRPGYAVEADGRNIPIGPPFPVPQTILAEAVALLTSGEGQHGGTHHWPDNLSAARFAFGDGRLPNDPANTPGPWTVATINTGDTFVTNRAQQQQMNGVTIPVRPSSGGQASGGQASTNENSRGQNSAGGSSGGQGSGDNGSGSTGTTTYSGYYYSGEAGGTLSSAPAFSGNLAASGE